MDRILLALAIAFFYSTAALAAGENRIYDEFRHSLVSYQENGFVGVKPIALLAGDERLVDGSAALEEQSIDDWLDRSSRNPEPGVGVGVAPFFDAYGVFRTGSSDKKTAYIALGYVSEELFLDDTVSPENASDSGFSFGFGVNDSSVSFEYMMSVGEEDYEISTIGMSFISEF